MEWWANPSGHIIRQIVILLKDSKERKKDNFYKYIINASKNKEKIVVKSCSEKGTSMNNIYLYVRPNEVMCKLEVW